VHSSQQKPNLRCKREGAKWIWRPGENTGSLGDSEKY